MAKLICDIVTPAAKLYSDEAYMVVVPGVEGEMGFLHGHVPLVSALADSELEAQLAALSEEEARRTPISSDIAWCKVQIAAVEA